MLVANSTQHVHSTNHWFVHHSTSFIIAFMMDLLTVAELVVGGNDETLFNLEYNIKHVISGSQVSDLTHARI